MYADIGKESLKQFLLKKFPDTIIDEKIFEYLFSAKIIEQKNLLRALIKKRYHDLLKGGSSANSASLDCAIEFGVSKSFVEKLIYRYKEIKV